MSDQAIQPTAPQGPEQPTHVTIPEKAPQGKPALGTALEHVAKHWLILIFAVYTLGFLIWHSYLAGYGLSSTSFLSTDYISAAFCFLVLLFIFTVPLFLITWHFVGRDHETLKKHRFTDSLFMSSVAVLFFIIHFSPISFLNLLNTSIVIVLLVCILIALIQDTMQKSPAKMEKRSRWVGKILNINIFGFFFFGLLA